jgi:hypothetical protein
MKIRSIKFYTAQGFSHKEAVQMRIFDVLAIRLFCEMTEEKRYSEENAHLIKKYDGLMAQLGI